MGATFSRLKNWTTEILTNTDLNLEIDNILNNLGPSGVDDYSTNAAQMRLTTNPGTVGSESLATSLSGELERLRFVLKRIIGPTVDEWYEDPPSTISDLVAVLGSGLPPNRIVSGRTTGNSSQLCALIPSGTTASLTLTASGTPFNYYVDGVAYAITANITLSGLSTAPTANTTAGYSAGTAAGQQWTKVVGQYGITMNIGSAGAEIVSRIGQIAGFKIGAEYFLAYINSSTALTQVWRGAFFNSSGAHMPAIALTNADEIKLMRLTWIFANTNQSLAVTYANPTISAEQPGAPNTGDYWFDLASTAWKTFNSTTWVAANATLIGISLQDTAACVAARTFDSFQAVDELNSLQFQTASNTVVQAANLFSEVSIFGTTNRFGNTRPTWDITTDLESGVGETASTLYYLYMKENGQTIVSDKAPTQRNDLRGLYHQAETWRCLGNVLNNASTHFQTPVRSFRDVPDPLMLAANSTAYNLLTGGLFEPMFMFPNKFQQSWAAPGTAWPAGNNTAADVATLSLTPGMWRLSGQIEAFANGTIPQTSIFLSMTTIQGTAAFSPLACLNTRSSWASTVSGVITPLSINDLFVIVDTPTDYYLKIRASTVGANLTLGGFRFNAERIDSNTGMPV